MEGDIVVSTAQMELYQLLKEIGPTTDYDLHYTLRENGVEITPSGVRHRRGRLVKKGLIRATARTVDKPGGKPLVVWKTTQVRKFRVK